MSHVDYLRAPTPGRYSAKKASIRVSFTLFAPQARAVSVMGDFNDWNPDAFPMKRHVDGAWHALVPLTHGHHHYLFVVDGKPTLDPRAQGIARNERNEKVSMIAVS
jgi:1,4-alpha-glucan branching enzyme